MNKGLVELAWGAFALLIGFLLYGIYKGGASTIGNSLMQKIESWIGGIDKVGQ